MNGRYRAEQRRAQIDIGWGHGPANQRNRNRAGVEDHAALVLLEQFAGLGGDI